MSIRIAIIGAGLMGADHARIVAGDLPGATLQVVCDKDGARARSVADACAAQDATCDPEATHETPSKACIAAGKRVLCEKPLSQASAECPDVLRAEQAAGRS